MKFEERYPEFSAELDRLVMEHEALFELYHKEHNEFKAYKQKVKEAIEKHDLCNKTRCFVDEDNVCTVVMRKELGL